MFCYFSANKVRDKIWRYMTYHLDRQIMDRVNMVLSQRDLNGMFGRSMETEKDFR